MNAQGKVIEVGNTIQVTEKLTKRELIVEIAENVQYPEYIKFEGIQDRCKLLDNVIVGDNVDIHFNLKGRPHVDKTGKKNYYNSLQFWKIDIVGANASNNSQEDEDTGSGLPF